MFLAQGAGMLGEMACWSRLHDLRNHKVSSVLNWNKGGADNQKVAWAWLKGDLVDKENGFSSKGSTFSSRMVGLGLGFKCITLAAG